MLEGFFYAQKKLPIILFSYIIPIRKDNKKMSLSRKHFRQIAKILGEHHASDELVNEFVSFCASQNSYFQRQTFLNAVDDHKNKNEKTPTLTLSGPSVNIFYIIL
jgi:hypothetical protein